MAGLESDVILWLKATPVVASTGNPGVPVAYQGSVDETSEFKMVSGGIGWPEMPGSVKVHPCICVVEKLEFCPRCLVYKNFHDPKRNARSFWSRARMWTLVLVLFWLWLSAPGSSLSVQSRSNLTSLNKIQSEERLSKSPTVNPDAAWERAVSKGRALWDAMQLGCYQDKYNPQSVWELQRKGWMLDPWPPVAQKLRQLRSPLSQTIIQRIRASSGADYYQMDLGYESESILLAYPIDV